MSDNQNKKGRLVFGKKNFIIMIAGVAVIFIGLILMSMGSKPYGFDALGITISPAVILIGFAIEFYAIMGKFENNSDSQAEEEIK
jgi:uncharacterized membrane protein